MAIVREMTSLDVQKTAELCGEFGFPVETKELEQRLTALKAIKNHQVFVAEIEPSLIVGWVHVYNAPSLISGPTSEIGGLIVSESCRRRGIGKLLMERAESWAKDQGCSGVLLATQTKRIEAQRFYENLGYSNLFSTYFMKKSIS
jgi:GNAT superfamily N-acetyltransferase